MTEADKAALELAERIRGLNIEGWCSNSAGSIDRYRFSRADRDLIVSRLKSPASVPEGHVAVPRDCLDDIISYGAVWPIENVVYGKTHRDRLRQINELLGEAPSPHPTPPSPDHVRRKMIAEQSDMVEACLRKNLLELIAKLQSAKPAQIPLDNDQWVTVVFLSCTLPERDDLIAALRALTVEQGERDHAANPRT